MVASMMRPKNGRTMGTGQMLARLKELRDASGATMYERVKQQKQWAEHRYSVKRLFAALPKETKEPRETRRISIKEHEAEIELRKHAEYSAKQAHEDANALRERLSALERENARLLGRIEELERQLSSRRAG
jgi:hypothetical protein